MANVNHNNNEEREVASKTSSDDDSTSSDTPSASPSPKNSLVYAGIDEQTASDILRMLRRSIDQEEWELKEKYKIDNTTQPIQVEKLFKNAKKDDDDEDELELVFDTQDRKDGIRIANLEKTRPVWLNLFLKIAFHICVVFNFFMAWYDSASLLLEDAKVNKWLLENYYICWKAISELHWFHHTMNITHALLSCSILFVHGKGNASLCLAWIFSEAVHTVFKTFQYFNNLKFDPSDASSRWHWDREGLPGLVGVILLDAFCALLLFHKYYDFTDLLKTRATNFGTTNATERSLNDGIIHTSQNAFLHRKNALRDVTTAQTFAIIEKIGRQMKQGIPLDAMALDREINAAKLALVDCSTAANDNMLYVLKKAYTRRLRELENEHQLKEKAAVNNTEIAQSK